MELNILFFFLQTKAQVEQDDGNHKSQSEQQNQTEEEVDHVGAEGKVSSKYMVERLKSQELPCLTSDVVQRNVQHLDMLSSSSVVVVVFFEMSILNLAKDENQWE